MVEVTPSQLFSLKPRRRRRGPCPRPRDSLACPQTCPWVGALWEGECGRTAAIGRRAAAFEGLRWTGQGAGWPCAPTVECQPFWALGALKGSAVILGERLFSREGISGWGSLDLFSVLWDSGGYVSTHMGAHKKYSQENLKTS